MKILDFLANGFFVFPKAGFEHDLRARVWAALINVAFYATAIYFAVKYVQRFWNSELLSPVRGFFRGAGKLSLFAQDSVKKARMFGRAA